MLPSTAKSIQLDAVSYKYPHTDKIALSEICYSFTRGTAAIVGPNGAGKSTLVKLLTGLLTPTSGWINVQLQDGTCIPPEQLHKAVLFQEPSHLYLTIRQNITMHFERTPNEDARIYYALEKAGLSKVVKGFADGIDTLVGAGFGGQTDLSGGQWQRLALARLIYQDAPVIILDEPVASLDPQGERAVFELFSQLSQSKIILFTTHRYDSIPRNTKIVVLVDGTITESGTHEELLEKQCDYWSLYMSETSNKANHEPALAGRHERGKYNGQINHSLSEFSLIPASASPKTASPSDTGSQPSLRFASARRSDELIIPPLENSSLKDVSLDHSAPHQTSTASPLLSQAPVFSPGGASILRKRPALVLALLALLLITTVETALLLHAAITPFVVQRNTHLSTPTVKAPATLTPGTSIYPPLVSSYAGIVSDVMTAEHSNLFLTNIQQSQGNIQGSFQGLGLVAPFTGTITSSGRVQFIVKIYTGSTTLIFEGDIKIGGDMAGSFTTLDQHGQRTGEVGLWNVSPGQ